jgi:hypothetical protein
MKRIFSITIITLVVLGVVSAVLSIKQRQEMDKALQGDDGNGTFYQNKRKMAAQKASLAEVFGDPNLVNHRAGDETISVSGSTWKNRLQKGIEDCVAAAKNLPASVGHRPVPAPIPVRHLAPDGVYFTLRYFSVRGPHGVIGILPGTEVVRMRDVAPSILRVSAGDLQFDAKVQDLTNDLDLVDAVSQGDAQRQKAVADYLDQQRAIHQAQQDEKNRLLDQQQRDAAAQISAAKASGYENPLERGPYHQIP